MKIRITADSTCDLGKEQAERFGVDIMPLTVVLGDDVFRDGVDIAPQNIFDYVSETGVLPKTAAPSVDDYTAFFEKQLEKADAVIHINISKLASSSYDNATVAAKKFKGKVFAVDSMALSTGQGLLAVKACDLAAENRKPCDIVEILEGLRLKINTSFVPDRLDYLHKGGRCSLASLIGAKVLKLHPLIDMKDGKLYAKKKYMGGLDRCLSAYVKDLAERYPHYDRTRCFIPHS
ncbi:MAG: DegV family protein, partial [Clostridia bacterium]|nr:DegV family protein [Clostridia bacterium]